MTRRKDLKKKTRARMAKTGESYTAARARLLAKRAAAPSEPEPEQRPATSCAALAGMSDAAVRAKTGCDWREWVGALDDVGAADWSHRAIAAHVAEKFELSSWWSQTVAVGYERIKGLREIGQRRSGAFEANKSRTLPVPVGDLYAAWADARRRRRWLSEPGLKIRKETPDRSLRITWPDGTSVALWFTAKGESKSTVQVQHAKLASRADAERRKAFWAERLAALAHHFEASRS